MKMAFHLLLATEMQFSKCSAVSVFSNWFHNSERKPGNAGNYQFFENVDFLFQALKGSVYICQNNDVKTSNFSKTQI